MKRVAYLRLFGIPEVDNVNKKYYEGLKCKVVEDLDGSKFESTINNINYDVVISGRTLANMLMHNIDMTKLDNEGVSAQLTMVKNREIVKQMLADRHGLSRYEGAYNKASAVSSDIECAGYIAITLIDDLEIMSR